VSLAPPDSAGLFITSKFVRTSGLIDQPLTNLFSIYMNPGTAGADR